MSTGEMSKRMAQKSGGSAQAAARKEEMLAKKRARAASAQQSSPPAAPPAPPPAPTGAPSAPAAPPVPPTEHLDAIAAAGAARDEKKRTKATLDQQGIKMGALMKEIQRRPTLEDKGAPAPTMTSATAEAGGTLMAMASPTQNSVPGAGRRLELSPTARSLFADPGAARALPSSTAVRALTSSLLPLRRPLTGRRDAWAGGQAE